MFIRGGLWHVINNSGLCRRNSAIDGCNKQNNIISQQQDVSIPSSSNCWLQLPGRAVTLLVFPFCYVADSLCGPPPPYNSDLCYNYCVLCKYSVQFSHSIWGAHGNIISGVVSTLILHIKTNHVIIFIILLLQK